MGVSENEGTLFGGPIIRILLFRVLYRGPLFSETPIYTNARTLYGRRKGPTPYLAVYNEGPMVEVPGASDTHEAFRRTVRSILQRAKGPRAQIVGF